MSPEEFLRKHEEFVARFTAPDGSVRPESAEGQAATGHTIPMSAGDHASHDVSGMDVSNMSSMSHDMPDMPMPEDTSDANAAPDHSAHRAAAAGAGGDPIDIYLLAYRFGFEPGELRLKAGQTYRFRMMASDIAHGASLNFGDGSRIIRLRPNVVSEQTITFQRPGPILVYCTVYCGPAHDMMKARILVA